MNEIYETNKNTIWRLIPTRITSRLWGMIISLYLPYIFRYIIYYLWGYIFNAKLEEAEKNILEYKNIQQFFTRKINYKLRPGLSKHNQNKNELICPVDGTLINICELDKNNNLEQIKGIKYSIRDFLGFIPKVINKNNKIIGCVFYLSPGDYHRFHSPCYMKIKSRTHFSGQLLPVNNIIVNNIPSLFTINERVCLYGKWNHGFISYNAVGATNVGSIVINFDEKLKTNQWFSRSTTKNNHKYMKPKKINKGDEIGYFKLGSTIVVIIEVPKDVKYNKSINSKVKVGDTLLSF
jgi:phosphatidylserine decarboxylase